MTPNTILRTGLLSYLASALGLLFLPLLITLAAKGCRGGADQVEAPEHQDAPRVTDVPLRVWAVAERFDDAAVQRRWRAASEQPIEIRVMSEGEFLAEQDPAADVILFPSRLLGELVSRSWIIKLPEHRPGTNTSGSGVDEGVQEASTSELLGAAEIAQVTYDGERYGASLGISTPVVLASGAFDAAAGREDLSIDAVLGSLPAPSPPAEQPDASSDVDAQAVVDRFLFLVGCYTDRSSKYGILFEMQTMRSRLQEREFVDAARALLRLAGQPEGGLAATIGSHNTAWEWIAAANLPAIAIVPPTLVDDLSVSSPETQLIRIQGNADFPAGWNTGGGLVAAVGAHCRQTVQSLALIDWLQQPATRNALAPLATGIDPTAPPAGADSLAWRARRALEDVLGSNAVPREPSLPGTPRYRDALGRELVAMLLGEKTAEQALRDAHEAWQAITESLGPEIRDTYEKSLGLTL